MSSKITRRNTLISMLLGAAACTMGCSTAFDDCRNTRSCGDAEAGSSGDSSDDQPSAGAGQGGGAGQMVVGVGEAGAAAGHAGAAGSRSGEGGEVGEGGEGGETAEADTIGPRVLSVTPASGSIGVESDAVITVTFDEPMDKVSAQLAFQSAELAGEVTFEWNTAGTVLTATPQSPLVYAADEYGVPTKAYTATIATTAVDLAGNGLQGAASTTFTTLRRGERTLQPEHMHRVSTDFGVIDITPPTCAFPIVGDMSNDTFQRVFIRFDLSSLPEHPYTVELAQLTVSLGIEGGEPLTELGPLGVTHYYEPTYSESSLLAPGLAELGTIAESNDDMGLRSLDVTTAVIDDIAHLASREDSSSYRFGLATTLNDDAGTDALIIACDPLPELRLEYTRP